MTNQPETLQGVIEILQEEYDSLPNTTKSFSINVRRMILKDVLDHLEDLEVPDMQAKLTEIVRALKKQRLELHESSGLGYQAGYLDALSDAKQIVTAKLGGDDEYK